MNFLELAQETDRILASQGVILSTDTTGYQDLLVAYVANAYSDIQTLRPEWLFLHTSVDITLTAGKSEYSIFDIFSTTDDPVSEWVLDRFIYEEASGSKSTVDYVPYREYVLSNWTSTQGKPVTFTVYPENNVLIFNEPDVAYTVTAHYFKKADLLVDNTDTPLMPSQFHNSICYQAASDIALKLGIIEVYELFKIKANVLIGSLLRSQNLSKKIKTRGIV